MCYLFDDISETMEELDAETFELDSLRKDLPMNGKFIEWEGTKDNSHYWLYPERKHKRVIALVHLMREKERTAI